MSSATLEQTRSSATVVQNPALLSVRGLRKHYRSGDRTLEVLRGVDLDLAAAEFVSIIGQSGSGKSTLLHLIGLLDAADEGSIALGERRIDDLPARQRDRLRNTDIGMVFQAYHLLPELTALENVLAPLMVRHGIWSWFKVRAEARRRGWRCSNNSVSASGSSTSRGSFPAGRCSGWRSPGPSWEAPDYCWPMSRPAILTLKPGPASSMCCAR